tara:strand:+ start:749 stop:1405 length:657 start_codon:yes stop_codon:yes gene_type:complete
MNFYKKSITKESNESFLYCVLSSVFDFFSFLSKKEKYRFIKQFSQTLSFHVSNKRFYQTNKLTKYEKQSVLEESFMNNEMHHSPGMIHVLVNFLDLNICFTEDKIGAFAYTIYAPVENHHLKASIFIKKTGSGYETLDDPENCSSFVNQYLYEDVSRYFSLYKTKKNNNLQPYYKYKIVELQTIAQKFNMNITKRGRGVQRIKKSKRELYDDLSSILA